MGKVMVALHGDELFSTLSAPTFRAALAAQGVTAVQINLDDEPVSAALRFGPGRPITALASMWLAPDADAVAPQAVLDVVVDATGESDLHAYSVTERVRLDPKPVPDGERADVYAQMALLRRPAQMSADEYLAYWMVEHTPIAIRTQNTSAYIQNIVDEALTAWSPAVSAIVEEHFPMAALLDPHEFYGSRGDDADLERRILELLESVGRFGAGDGLDLVPTSRYLWQL